jgi:hypothetical protein
MFTLNDASYIIPHDGRAESKYYGTPFMQAYNLQNKDN